MITNNHPTQPWEQLPISLTDEVLLVDQYQVMMKWEEPIMHKMAQMLHQHTQGDILEAGFGMGISASEIQRLGVRSHTIIEPHPKVYAQAKMWQTNQQSDQIEIIQDYWENVSKNLPATYDGIFFDTYSATVPEMDKKRFDLFQMASTRLLRENGALTFFYLRPELDSRYQELLMRYFRKVIIEKLPIIPPEDCNYAQFIRECQYTLCILAIK